MNEPLLSIRHVCKQFSAPISWGQMLSFSRGPRTSVTALDNVSFSVSRGKVVGILGPNGAGKTTLLKIIATLILPDSGTVFFRGKDISRDERRFKARIGLVTSEERNFYWRLTGRQNLEFFAAMHGLDPVLAKKRIAGALAMFDISYAHRRFDCYSAGMKRALALARAMLHDPDVLLLDEPTKSLDYNTAAGLRRRLETLKQANKTILLATHLMEEAEQVCDEFIILHQGTVRAAGTLETLRQSANLPAASLAELYLGMTAHAQ